MKYLITGKNGQLAKAFVRKFEDKSIHFIAPEEKECDITVEAKVFETVNSHKPDVIINCAAYNHVDRAEKEQELAFEVNGAGPQILARAAQNNNSFLVHFSSDYVFDGTKENGLYTESDTTNPVNMYGKTKLDGEKLIKETTDKFLILRLSWVFGEGKQNFIYRVLEWAERNEYLKISCDEFSVPTSTETVVDITLRALDRGLSGLYHSPNSGFCSRYEWAKFVLGSMGINKFITPVYKDNFNLAARRPNFSAMSNKEISRLLNIDIPGWEESVKIFLNERKSRSKLTF